MPKPFWNSLMLLPPLLALAGACGGDTSSGGATGGSAGNGRRRGMCQLCERRGVRHVL